MASVLDVSNKLANMIQTIVYPNGINNVSIANVDIAIYVGWPIPKVLDSAMLANKIVVSIFPNAMERNVTRGLGNKWEDFSINPDGITGESVKETKRQEKTFQITTWANNPDSRELVSKVIDSELSDINRIQLVDSVGNMNYVKTAVLDDLEKEGIYKCDLFYQVEYPTTKIETDPVVQHNTINVYDLVTDVLIDTNTI